MSDEPALNDQLELAPIVESLNDQLATIVNVLLKEPEKKKRKTKSKDIETNRLKKKIDSALLTSLAGSGVYVVDGKIVLEHDILAATNNVENVMLNASMRPRKTKQLTLPFFRSHSRH